jgi:hypothetical protein
MLDAGDWAQMTADLVAVRGDNEASITIRRGATTLAAQDVRVAGASAGRTASGEFSQEARGTVTVLGGTTFDVAPEDRFNVNGLLYRVVAVRTNRRAAVMATAELVE